MLNRIIEGIGIRPIYLIGSPRAGKTELSKIIADELRKQDATIRVFDACFDEETEILTKQGWKYFKDLELNEVVATLNKDNDKIEYQQITEKIVTTTQRELYFYEGHSLNFAVTENHRFYIRKRQRRGRVGEYKKYAKPDKFTFKETTIRELSQLGTGNRYYIPRSSRGWMGENQPFFVLPEHISKNKSRIYDKPPKQINMIKWLKFLGLYLAEGYTNKKNYIRIDQAHKNASKVKAIRRILKDVHEDVKEYNYTNNKNVDAVSFAIHDKRFGYITEKLGKARDKYIPRWCLQLNKKCLAALLGGMMVGDGCFSGGTVSYSTGSKQLADDVQELCFKLGFTATINKCGNMYEIIFNNRKYVLFNKKNITIKPYNKQTYCVSVPNQIIYVRRNGSPFWSMNSLAWWHQCPLSKRYAVEYEDEVHITDDCLFDLGRLKREGRQQVIIDMVSNIHNARYEMKLTHPDFFSRVNLDVTFIEEEQNMFKKFGVLEELHDWASMGMNFKMSAVHTTQRPAEVRTDILERCDILVGYTTHENNLKKLAKATDEEFMRKLHRITSGSHEFLYYNGETHGPFTFTPRTYATPSTVGSVWDITQGKYR